MEVAAASSSAFGQVAGFFCLQKSGGGKKF